MKTFEEVEVFLNEKKKKDESYIKKQKQADNFIYDKPVINNRTTPRRTRSIMFMDVKILLKN